MNKSHKRHRIDRPTRDKICEAVIDVDIAHTDESYAPSLNLVSQEQHRPPATTALHSIATTGFPM